MENAISLGKSSDIPEGAMKGFEVDGRKVLVSKVGGKFYATDLLCTHVKAPLDKGSLEGETVTCPWHGSQFNVETGEVLKGPAKDALKKYSVKEENGELSISF